MPFNGWSNNYLGDVAITDVGDIYLCPPSPDYAVWKIDSLGNILTKWQSYDGEKDEMFSNPIAMTMDEKGNIYVLDEKFFYCRIQKFDEKGHYLQTFQFAKNDVHGFAVSGHPIGFYLVTLSGVEYFGAGGESLHKNEDFNDFLFTKGITSDSSGNIYITGFNKERTDPIFAIKLDSSLNVIQKFDKQGIDFEASDIKIDREGNIYAGSQWEECLYKFDSEDDTKNYLLNYPNPFNSMTKIQYALPNDCHVSLKIYDVLGREVVELVKGENKAGVYEVELNSGFLTSGIYFYRIKAGEFHQTNKMIVVKQDQITTERYN
ncbi:T9SS type A sorting domain-containing protein [candidate division KSB1 bacterium]|nr:T9SS type A sorting domain-containing protein [candidate division KSB1 bacterium]